MENSNTNYFLAGFSWMANAGVVPWFLSFAFLLAPPFLVLFALLASVILVLDTIYQLLKPLIRSRFLPIQALYVKKLLLVGLIILFKAANANESWIISKGEHRELHCPTIQSYSISNKDVVAHKLHAKSKKLLIKGKKLGYSELLIWHRNGKKSIIQIYVLSKNKQLEILHLAQTLRSLGLQTEIAGPLITVSGTISDFKSYLLVKRFEKENKDRLHLKVELEKGVKNYIIGEAYRLLFGEYIDNIQCDVRFSTILCQYSSSSPPSQKLINYLERELYIQMIPIQNLQSIKNYRITMKLVLLEKQNGNQINWGLSKLDTHFRDLFERGLEALVENNQIFLGQHEVDLSSLAEPELLLTIGKNASIQVGADIPYQQGVSGSENLTTSWKFAGLKVDFNLIQVGKSIQIAYSTEFTKPDGDTVSGSKQQSVFTSKLGIPQQIFEIGFQTNGVYESSIPILNQIPVLGLLFKSKSNQQTYKKIIGIIKLEHYEAS